MLEPVMIPEDERLREYSGVKDTSTDILKSSESGEFLKSTGHRDN